MPAIFADSTRLLIRSARRCSCVSTLAHFAFHVLLFRRQRVVAAAARSTKKSAPQRQGSLIFESSSQISHLFKLLCLPFQARQLLQLPARSETCRLRKDRSLLFPTRADRSLVRNSNILSNGVGSSFNNLAVARTQSGFATGASWPCSINTARNNAAKLDKLSLIKSHNFSIETEAGM